MPTYVTLINWTDQGIKNFKDRHGFWIDSRWAWSLSPSEVTAYKGGRCPT
jgi:hypothetical protein